MATVSALLDGVLMVVSGCRDESVVSSEMKEWCLWQERVGGADWGRHGQQQEQAKQQQSCSHNVCSDLLLDCIVTDDGTLTRNCIARAHK